MSVCNYYNNYILYHNTADCDGQRYGPSLLDAIDYLNPVTGNITFRDCPPATTPTKGAMQNLTTGVY